MRALRALRGSNDTRSTSREVLRASPDLACVHACIMTTPGVVIEYPAPMYVRLVPLLEKRD